MSENPDGFSAILTFVDEDGNEWLAGAWVTELQRKGTNEVMPVHAAGGLLDRALSLKGFTVVGKPPGD